MAQGCLRQMVDRKVIFIFRYLFRKGKLWYTESKVIIREAEAVYIATPTPCTAKIETTGGILYEHYGLSWCK